MNHKHRKKNKGTPISYEEKRGIEEFIARELYEQMLDEFVSELMDILEPTLLINDLHEVTRQSEILWLTSKK